MAAHHIKAYVNGCTPHYSLCQWLHTILYPMSITAHHIIPYVNNCTPYQLEGHISPKVE